MSSIKDKLTFSKKKKKKKRTTQI